MASASQRPKTTFDNRPSDLIGSSILETPLDHYPDCIDAFLTVDPEVYTELSKTQKLPAHVFTSADLFLPAHGITIADIALYLSHPIPTTSYTLEFVLYKRRSEEPITYGFDVDTIHSLVATRIAFDSTIPAHLVNSLCSNYIEPRLRSSQLHWEATMDKRSYSK